MTALPLIETLEGEVSAYIPTNVISITDGQIYLQPDLFFAGVRPAVDVGISVSRVGGKAQIPAMKKVAGGLRLDLAAFRELEAFAQLGTELDKATQQQLDRGYRMVELLKQPQYQPMDVVDQVMSIYAGSEGYLDAVPVKEVSRWEEQFLTFIREQKPEVREMLVKEKKLSDGVVRPEGRPRRVQGQYRPTAPAVARWRTGPGPGRRRGLITSIGAGGSPALLRSRTLPPTHPESRTTDGQGPSDRQAPQVGAEHPQDHADDGADRHRAVQEGPRPRDRGGGLHPEDRRAGRRPRHDRRRGLAPAPGGPRAGRSKSLLLMLTSNRGLAGGYNGNVIRVGDPDLAGSRDRTSTDPPGGLRQARDRLLPVPGIPVDATYLQFEDRPQFEEVEKLADASSGCCLRGEIDRVDVAYTKFVNGRPARRPSSRPSCR